MVRTDATDKDSDDDGVTDAEEHFDKDGVDNEDELDEFDTSPRDADSDDGTRDGDDDADDDGLDNEDEDDLTDEECVRAPEDETDEDDEGHDD